MDSSLPCPLSQRYQHADTGHRHNQRCNVSSLRALAAMRWFSVATSLLIASQTLGRASATSCSGAPRTWTDAMIRGRVSGRRRLLSSSGLDHHLTKRRQLGDEAIPLASMGRMVAVLVEMGTEPGMVCWT
jgi:hypothetical protein